MDFSSKINNLVVLNNAMLAEKNFWINTRVDTVIRVTRVCTVFSKNYKQYNLKCYNMLQERLGLVLMASEDIVKVHFFRRSWRNFQSTNKWTKFFPEPKNPLVALIKSQNCYFSAFVRLIYLQLSKIGIRCVTIISYIFQTLKFSHKNCIFELYFIMKMF